MNALAVEQLAKHKGKIVWLSSYPKSGNTWLRIFLSALFTDNEVNLNNLPIYLNYASRVIYDSYSFIDTMLLNTQERKKYVANTINHLTQYQKSEELLFVKIHDKFDKHMYDFIHPESTLCIVYITRNPLSIASSLASHINATIDYAIEFMNSKKAILGYEEDSDYITTNQYTQHLSSWHEHYKSWHGVTSVPVHTIKYEDIKRHTQDTFTSLLQQLELNFPEDQISRAVQNSSIKTLQKKEQESGFKEKSHYSISFFRKGEINSWKKELTKKQQNEIISNHKVLMEKLGYLNR